MFVGIPRTIIRNCPAQDLKMKKKKKTKSSHLPSHLMRFDEKFSMLDFITFFFHTQHNMKKKYFSLNLFKSFCKF